MPVLKGFGDAVLARGSDSNHPAAVQHAAALRSGSFNTVPCFMQCSSRQDSCLGGRALSLRTSSQSGVWPAAGALRCQHRPCV